MRTPYERSSRTPNRDLKPTRADRPSPLTGWTPPPSTTASRWAPCRCSAPTPTRPSCSPPPRPEVGRAAGKSLHGRAPSWTRAQRRPWGWPAPNAPRSGFIKRYSWELWHYG